MYLIPFDFVNGTVLYMFIPCAAVHTDACIIPQETEIGQLLV
jgi:hypothetical protein